MAPVAQRTSDLAARTKPEELKISRYAKVRFQALSSVASWRPKSPADVGQESDGVCSDPARDVSIAGSSAIALGNHRVCCDFGRISLLLSLSERKKTQVVFGAQKSITFCVTSVIKRGKPAESEEKQWNGGTKRGSERDEFILVHSWRSRARLQT